VASRAGSGSVNGGAAEGRMLLLLPWIRTACGLPHLLTVGLATVATLSTAAAAYLMPAAISANQAAGAAYYEILAFFRSWRCLTLLRKWNGMRKTRCAGPTCSLPYGTVMRRTADAELAGTGCARAVSEHSVTCGFVACSDRLLGWASYRDAGQPSPYSQAVGVFLPFRRFPFFWGY